MNRRLKVLVSAYACSPVRGSEPGMGWHWVEALSAHHDLWVITEKQKFQAEVEDELDRRPWLRDRMTFFYIAKKRHRTLRKFWPPSYYWFYRTWHQKAYDLAKSLQAKVGFDLAHQLNMVGFREPGYLWRLNVPFVWGPVGGTAQVPLRFASALGFRGFLFHLGRNAVNAWQMRCHARVKAALSRADGFVTATRDTHDTFLRIWRRDSVVIHDAACRLGEVARARTGEPGRERSLRLVFSGQHLPRKALPVVLHALAALPPACPWHLDVLGSGPMTPQWQRLADRLGLGPKCTWHGWLGKAEAVARLGGADLMLFPSLQEGTPHVVLEALSLGVPVVCFDHCGQADVVTPSCGVKVPVSSPREAVRDFTQAVLRLATHPGELARLSRGALAHSRTVTWAHGAQAMCRVYEQALEAYAAKRAAAGLEAPSDGATLGVPAGD